MGVGGGEAETVIVLRFIENNSASAAVKPIYADCSSFISFKRFCTALLL